jgi:short-subunit dehydrogenase
MSGTVLILGATSAIARATAAAFAARGHALYLAARDQDELARIGADLALRYGIDVHHGPFDARATDTHTAFLEHVLDTAGELDGVVLAFGLLGDQQQARSDFTAARAVIDTNFTGAASILTLCADHFEQQATGFIIGISSVAGDRGRQSNYTYGAAKGALSLYLAGLRNRLHAAGVRVVTVKPGFVDTAMTFGLPGMFLVASPDSVGRRIARAAESGTEVVYTPWFWRYIMLIIRLIPERLFKRLQL